MNEIKKKNKEKSYLFIYIQGIKAAKKATYRTFCDDLANFPRDGLMVSALDSGASAPGSSPGLGHCVVFLGKTLYSHGASLHSDV